MLWTRPVLAKGADMGGGAVTFVRGEIVNRMGAVEFTHEAVTGDLCDDTGGGDEQGF